MQLGWWDGVLGGRVGEGDGRGAYAGTAGAMLLFWVGREGESSLSRRVFSEERMRRDVMMMGEAERGRLRVRMDGWGVGMLDGVLMVSELGVGNVKMVFDWARMCLEHTVP